MSKRIVILGAGESGTGAALLAKAKGFDVFLSDLGTVKETFRSELLSNHIAFEEGTHTLELILSADEIIKSPGIPEKSEVMKTVRSKGISVISELEFASRYTKARMVGITGTNGKTTTTMLTYHMLKKAGLKVGLAGNVGYSLARQVIDDTYDCFVLELSSFQLDDMHAFRVHIAVLLNITPDHLDRYDYQLDNYVRSKFRILQNQTVDDFFIYCLDDEITMQHIHQFEIKAKQLPLSIIQQPLNGAYTHQEQLTISFDKPIFTMYLSDLTLKGKHNQFNSMAAAIIGSVFALRKEIIRESLMDFQNVEHRLENVGKVGGVNFINDSKATNVNSAWYALETVESPIIWIAGGVDKGNDYSILKPLVKDKVRIIVCLGLDNRKIHEAFSKEVDMIVNTTSAMEAVKVAYRLALKGESVLLSPACASFDLFENYEDRGRQFKKAVRNL